MSNASGMPADFSTVVQAVPLSIQRAGPKRCGATSR